MSPSLVSVIMPAHNAAPFIGDAIRSVLAQTHRDLELLIIDDASTDGTGEVARAVADPRIRFQRSETPLNAAGARNLALENARGDVIAFLDADDIAEPRRIERQFAALRNADIAASLVTSIDARGRALGPGFVRKRAADEIAPTLLFENCIALSSVTARRSALENFRPELAPAEDYDLWVRSAPKVKFVIIPRRLTRYRTNVGGVSVRQPEQMRTAVAAIHTAQLDRLDVSFAPIHAQLAAWPLHPTMGHLYDAGRWLLALRDANDRAAVYPRAVFHRVIAGRWFRVCLDSWLLGWPVWKIFHRSPLAAPTLLQRALLFRRVFAR